jgi:3-oxoacyl-[acyl-carrier protein] reductase
MAMPRALVIGGRRGIGAAVVQALADRGYFVTYTYRTEPGPVAPQIEARWLDLADRAAVDAFAVEQEGAEAWDAVVQVGGTTYDALAAVMDQQPAEAAMQVNFFAFARIARAVVRPMLRARTGRIVAIGSVIGQLASQGNAAYGATKAALLAYVRSLAIESARRGVTVNYVAPGFVDTDMMAPFAAYRDAAEGRIPAARYGRPEEIAAVVAFLVSPEAGYVNGAYIPVDGGMTAALGVSRG